MLSDIVLRSLQNFLRQFEKNLTSKTHYFHIVKNFAFLAKRLWSTRFKTSLQKIKGSDTDEVDISKYAAAFTKTMCSDCKMSVDEKLNANMLLHFESWEGKEDQLDKNNLSESLRRRQFNYWLDKYWNSFQESAKPGWTRGGGLFFCEKKDQKKGIGFIF